jgi:outer membrane protein
MKKLLLGAVLAFGVLTATAQNKIGHINFGEFMGSMPEVEKAQKAITAYQQEQAQTYQELTIELNALDSAFNVDSIKLNETRKEIKRREINEKYIGLQRFEQEAKEKIQQKQEDIVAPIREKAIKAINDVAKENGYAYVINDDGNNLLVKPQGDNLMSLAKAKLGIKPPAAPATKPTTPGVRK